MVAVLGLPSLSSMIRWLTVAGIVGVSAADAGAGPSAISAMIASANGPAKRNLESNIPECSCIAPDVDQQTSVAPLKGLRWQEMPSPLAAMPYGGRPLG